MEQNGISIISPPGVTENSVGKSQSIGITLRSNSFQSAKEKLKAPWLKKMEKDGTWWDNFVILLAELIGTAFLVFVGCMSCIPSHKLGILVSPSDLQVSLAFGITVMIVIQCIGHISGADINPAITLATVIIGKKSFTKAGCYIVAQCLGGMIGFGLLKMISPSEFIYDSSGASSFCTTNIDQYLTPLQGFATEALATGILVFFACGIWDARNAKNTDSLALRFGLCVTALCLAFIPYTGCSMNPARSFGPAVWHGYWVNHWIYWLGPFVGAAVAALIYRCIFLPKRDKQEDIAQDTLNGIET